MKQARAARITVLEGKQAREGGLTNITNITKIAKITNNRNIKSNKGETKITII